jgi:drug/metabolite transporter (DMT)-like permease
MDWLPLSLLCAFSLASADAATKKLFSDTGTAERVIVRFGYLALFLLPFLWLHPPVGLPPVFWAWIAPAIPLELLAMILYVRAIHDSPLGLTLPYLAFTPVLVTLTGWLLLDERVTGTGLAGILLVVAGAYLLNIEHLRIGQWRSLLAPFTAIVHERGSRRMLMVATIYSITAVLGKGALQYMPPLGFSALYFLLTGAFTVALFAARKPQRLTILWRRPGASLLVGGLMTVMIVSHFAALDQVEVAYMIAVKRTSLLFAMLYGAWLFAERRLGQRLLAGSIMVAGVFVLAAWG